MIKDFDSSKFMVPAIIAGIGDAGMVFGFVFGIFFCLTGVLLPLGLLLIMGSIIWHCVTGLMMLFFSWPNLPKGSLKQKIIIVMNPKFWLILAVALPLPVLLIGLIIALLMQNKIVQMLVEQAVILGLAAATGGAGLAAEAGAVGGAVATEGAAATAEAGAAATEGAAATAEAGTKAVAESGEAAAKAGSGETKSTFKQKAKKKGKDFIKKKIKEGLEQEDGGEENEENDEEESLSPEEQELEEILSGDYVGRSIRENLGAEQFLSDIGDEELGAENSDFDPEKMGPEMAPKPAKQWAAANDNQAPKNAPKGIINSEQVNLKNAAAKKNKELLQDAA